MLPDASKSMLPPFTPEASITPSTVMLPESRASRKAVTRVVPETVRSPERTRRERAPEKPPSLSALPNSVKRGTPTASREKLPPLPPEPRSVPPSVKIPRGEETVIDPAAPPPKGDETARRDPGMSETSPSAAAKRMLPPSEKRGASKKSRVTPETSRRPPTLTSPPGPVAESEICPLGRKTSELTMTLAPSSFNEAPSPEVEPATVDESAMTS